tara:strand:+ start:1408 stop:1710 length:303 start_codon:yes stop_codon:yes gene_type:complete
MIGKELFTESLEALRTQYDIDLERSKRLSEIYGADIDPVDNSAITSVLFKILDFNNNKGKIETFCYEENFGRHTKRTIEDLWYSLVKDIKVNYEVINNPR